MDVLIQVLRGRVVIQAEQGYLKRGSMVKGPFKSLVSILPQ